MYSFIFLISEKHINWTVLICVYFRSQEQSGIVVFGSECQDGRFQLPEDGEAQ